MCHIMHSWRNILIVFLLINPSGMYAGSVAAEAVIKPMHLSPCPGSPNCVSSDATDPSHHAPPFVIILPAKEAWLLVRGVVKDMPRTNIVEITDDYLHAECTSAVFRFVDDLELELRAGEGVIAVRSASRTGHSDFGVNRRRVERLRELLRAKGVIK